METVPRRPGWVDPDPFTIAVGIAGIVGGVASAVAMYRSVAPNQSLRQRRNLRVTLGEVDDLLRYVETDIQLIRDLMARADLGPNRTFRLGSNAFLSPDDFDRYAQVTDNVFARLKKLLSSTHTIERAFSRIDPFPGFEPVARLDDIQGSISRLLRDERQTVEEAIDGLGSIVGLTRQLIRDLEDALSFEV